MGVICEPEIDEPGPGKFDRVDRPIVREVIDDGLAELARRLARELGRTQRDVAGKVAMLGVSCPLDAGVEPGKLGGPVPLGQSVERVADELFEFVTHGS